MKKLLSVISVIILVLVGVNFLLPTVSAQMVDRNADLVQTTLEELVKTNSLPTLLEIKDISPAKSTYTQGEGVAGTFVIKNTHDYNIPDLKYQISLVGGYGVDGLAREIYDSRFYGPIFLRSGETKEINFGYLLPSNVAGSNLGLRIRLYTSTGLPLVWKDKPLEVTGGNSMMKISDAYLNVGNTKYSVSAGPTLSATKKAVINVKLENPFNQERTLTPEIKIYSGSAMGAVLKTTTLKPFTISAKGTKSFSSGISYFDRPGIYEVAVNFYNSQKVKVAPTTLAKYVVSGPMAVIQQITLDKNTLKSGKDFNFKMAYTGIPKDIDQPSVHKENILNVLVTILNEEAFLVASYNSKIDFNKGTVLEVPLTAKETAKKVFVNVVVTDALGNKITAYNQEITGNPTSNNFPGVLWLIGLVFLLAIIIISVFYRKNKVLKASLFIGIFCYSIFSAGTAMAYQGTLPEIYVSNVKLEKDIYNPGDTVKGTFLLKNYDPVVAPDIYYEIKLAGDYKNTLAKIFYDHSEMIGPLILAEKENKTIAFEYKLPENLAGKGFGIQVQSMLKTGTGMGWSDGFFDITGTSSFIKAEANISTSASTAKTYFLQQGPMVYKGEKAYVNMEFSNNHNLGQDVYPKLTIYDRSEARGILLTKEESVIKVPAAGVTKNRIELPVFNYVPRVYVGKLEFFDKAGAQVSNTLDFRYIVFGQMVTINNVISDKEYAYKDDTINLSIDVTGAPLDINDLSISASSTGSIAIKLFNENNVLVGESVEADIDFNANDIKVYPIQITEKAKTLKAEVKAISPTGEPLGELTVNLTKSPMPGFTLLGLLKIKAFAYALVVVIILLVLFGIRFSIKKKNKLALVLFFVAILIVISWIGIIRTERADAFVSIVKSQHRYTFTFYLNYPNPGDTFIPGQKVTVQAQAKYHACDNVADSAHLTLANNGLSNNPITVYSANSSFSIPNFQLSSTPWENNLDFKFVWDYAPTENYEIGYQPYIIQPVISAVTSPNCGGKVSLSWVADLEPDLNYYKIYNKGVLLATSTTNSIDVEVPSVNSLTWSSYYTTTMGGRQLGVVTRFNERTPLSPRTISWRSVTGALSYDIKVYNKPGVPNGTVMVSGLTGTSYTFTDANSAPYRFIIQTITAPVSTESGKSKAVQAVPSSACAYPPLAGSCTSGISYDEEYSDPLLITWGVVSTGGSGIYRYVWNGDSSLSNSSLTINPSMDNGTFDAKVVIYDYNDMSKSVTISCPTVVIGPCTGSIPAGSTACSDTLQDRGGAWTPVSSCSVPAGQCEYHAIATTTLSAVTSPDCGGNVSLSWTAVPEATLGYRIYRSTGGGSPVLFASTAATSYMASSTVGDTFTVRTVITGQVESLSSNSVSATPSAPCAPLNLTATAATEPSQCGGYTTLSWTAVPGVDGYHVYRGTETTPLITTTATSTTLLASFTDYFIVKTYLGTQESEPSNFVKGVPSAPCAPLNLTATAATEPSQCGGYTTLRWGEVPGATGYHVYNGTTRIATTTATSTTILALVTDYFIVKAYLGTQESSASNGVYGAPSDPCNPNGGGNPDEGNYCSSTAGECIGGATPSPPLYTGGDWTCTKTDGDEIQVSSCSAMVSESLSCTLSLTSPSLPPINRGSNSIWTVTPYPSGTYTYNWYIKNSNNTVVIPTKPYGTSIPVADHGSFTLEYVLRTLGANTVTVKVSSGSKVAYCSNTPSVSVVASGGSNLEF